MALVLCAKCASSSWGQYSFCKFSCQSLSVTSWASTFWCRMDVCAYVTRGRSQIVPRTILTAARIPPLPYDSRTVHRSGQFTADNSSHVFRFKMSCNPCLNTFKKDNFQPWCIYCIKSRAQIIMMFMDYSSSFANQCTLEPAKLDFKFFYKTA
jgi:hypothetical protein